MASGAANLRAVSLQQEYFCSLTSTVWLQHQLRRYKFELTADQKRRIKEPNSQVTQMSWLGLGT